MVPFGVLVFSCIHIIENTINLKKEIEKKKLTYLKNISTIVGID
jgi:hypothetical protein